jgi:hypothetical protein
LTSGPIGESLVTVGGMRSVMGGLLGAGSARRG